MATPTAAITRTCLRLLQRQPLLARPSTTRTANNHFLGLAFLPKPHHQLTYPRCPLRTRESTSLGRRSFHHSSKRQFRQSQASPFRSTQTKQQNQQWPNGPYRSRPQSVGTIFLQFLRRWAARPTFYYELGGLGLATGSFYVYNLEEVPVSGRRRFNVVSEDLERQIADGQYKEVLGSYRGSILPKSDPRSRQVQRVMQRLIPSSGALANQPWTFDVIDDPRQMNAFVIPGGHVFVFTGVLPICQDDDGLATVLSHEIGHTVARHLAEQLSQRSILLFGSWIVESIFGLPIGTSRLFVSLGFERPKSRAQESEADYLGLMMMAQSCYNPSAALSFWQRMQNAEQSHSVPPQFLSTHPSSDNRRLALEALLPKALDARGNSNCGALPSYMAGFQQSTRNLRDDFFQ